MIGGGDAETAIVGPLQIAVPAPLQIAVPTPLQIAAPTPLQTTTGGSGLVVLLVFLTLFLATVLSVYLALRLYRGYRETGGRGMLLLGVGLVALTTVPILLRLVLSNVPGVPPTTRATLATVSQLLGLLVVLGVVYGGR